LTLPEPVVRLLDRIEPSAMRLGLDAPRRLLAELGEPQARYPAVLVAGTNGKGSTAAWLAAMTVAAGYRTGLYTSPHLEEVMERVRIDGRAVSGVELGGWLLEVAAAAEKTLGGLPTYFELVTAAAFLGFAAAEVDLAVVEVGMGGRLDATNVADPVLSIITEIGLDHERHLGTSLAEIASEKAGILRHGRPAIAGCSQPEALAAVRSVASEVGADLAIAATEASWRSLDEPAGAFEVTTGERAHHLRSNLAGAHQVLNLTLAVLAAEELRRRGWAGIDGAAIAAGAAGCRWPGRLESVTLPDRPSREVLLDVAHNPDAARQLVAHLERLGRPYDLLFGTLADKRSDLILPRLAAAARRLVLTRPAGDRGLEPEALLPLVPSRQVIVEPGLRSALDKTLAGTAPLVVICGSFYLVGEARRLLTNRFGTPPPATAIASC
jgi:dihydrofolate synthase/folylpolyglutamate synthase